MKNLIPYLFLLLILGIDSVSAQVSINNDSSPPHPSAMLDIKSDSLGILIPRAYTDSIVGPATGLQVQNLSDNRPYFYNGIGWEEMEKVKRDTITIYPSSVYSLASAPVTFIPAPGPETFINIIGVYVYLDYQGTPYINDTGLEIFLGSEKIMQESGTGILVENQQRLLPMKFYPGTQYVPINVPAMIRTGQDNSDGNSPIKVISIYTEEKIPQ